MNEAELKAQHARLLRFREATGYPGRGGQTAFAKEIGVSPGRWNNFERGYSPLTWKVARMIRERFPSAPVEWLLTGETGQMTLDWAKRLGELPDGSGGASMRPPGKTKRRG